MLKNTLKVTTPSDHEIVITRVFNAPREVAWKAMTTPEFLRRWLFGPPGWEMTVCEDDHRPGGKFRWAWRGPNGEDIAMHGVNREVSPPGQGGTGGRVVRTETFDFGCAAQSGEQICTLQLTEQPGNRTLLTITILYPSKEARDGAIASGMEHGMAAGYDRLEDLLMHPA